MAYDKNLRDGIAAVKAGDLERAQSLLNQVVRANPNSEEGWLWLGQCVGTPARRAFCLQKVLAINPNNAEARRLLQESPSTKSALPETLVPKTALPFVEASTRPVSEPESKLTSPPEPPVVDPPTPQPTTVPIPAAIIPPPVISTPVTLTPSPPTDPPPTGVASPTLVTPPTAKPAPAEPPPSTGSRLSGWQRTAATVLVVGFGVYLIVVTVVLFVLSGRVNISTALLGTSTPTSTATATRTATPTRTALPTATATAQPTATAAPSTTPTLSAAQRLGTAQPALTQAQKLLSTHQAEAALKLLDETLANVPEDSTAFALRAQTHRALVDSKTTEKDQRDQAQLALADINQALKLKPGTAGDLHLERARVYQTLARLETYRVNQDYWNSEALSEVELAEQQGHSDKALDHYPARALIAIGQCEAGLEAVNNLIKAAANNATPDLNQLLAEGYLCSGKPVLAERHSALALEADPTAERQWLHAIALYNMLLRKEAVLELDALIISTTQPCACWYYLRALNHFDLDRPDLAQADVEAGDKLTWQRGALRAYVMGLLALQARNAPNAIIAFQEAEATLPRIYGLIPLRRLQQRLAELNAPLLTPEVAAAATPTPRP